MAEVFFKIESFWQKEPTKCEPCFLCEDLIFSDTNRLCFKIGNRIDQSDICLCNSCFELIKKDGL